MSITFGTKLDLAAIMQLPPDQQNIALIFDRSEKGNYALSRFLSGGPAYIAGPLAEKVRKAGNPRPQFVCFLGALPYSGGTTAFAEDADDLLETVLPAFMERIAQRGGICPFMLGVEPSMTDRIETRIKALSPKIVDGEVVASPQMKASSRWQKSKVIDPLFGGTVHDFSQIVFEPAAGGPVWDALTDAGSQWLAIGNEEMSKRVTKPHSEALPDGTLRLAIRLPSDDPEKALKLLDVSPNSWRTREAEYRKMGEQAGVRLIEKDGRREILFFLPRDVIERKDIDSALRCLSTLDSEPAASHHAGRLVINVDGYDDDPRQLCYIPEVTAYFEALHDRWPMLPLHLDKDKGEFLLFFSLVGRGRQMEGAVVFTDTAKFLQAVTQSVDAINSHLGKLNAPLDGVLDRQAKAAGEMLDELGAVSRPGLRPV